MISFRVEEQTLKRTDSTTVVNNSVGYLKAEFDFSNEWAGYEKYAQFNNYEVHISAEDNSCDVPSEALRNKTALNVNVYGKDYDDNKFLTTNMTTLNLVQSGYSEEIVPNYEELYNDAQEQVNYQDEIIDSLNARIIELEQQLAGGGTGGGEEPVEDVENGMIRYVKAYVNGAEATEFNNNDYVSLKVGLYKDYAERNYAHQIVVATHSEDADNSIEELNATTYADVDTIREFDVTGFTFSNAIKQVRFVTMDSDGTTSDVIYKSIEELGWTILGGDSGSGDAVEYGLEIVEELNSSRELSIGHTNTFKVSKTPYGYKDDENIYKAITAESSNEAVIKLTEVDTEGFNATGFGTTVHDVSIEAVGVGNATITFSLIGLDDDVLDTVTVDYAVIG